MKPYKEKVIIGDATLYLADAVELIPHLKDDGVKLIVSDLPYKLTSGGGNTGKMGGKFKRENYPNNGNIILCDVKFEDYMHLLADIMPQGHAYFMVNNRHIGKVEAAALAGGFRLHNWLTWDKITATQNRWYMKHLEFTLFVFRGKAVPITDCSAMQSITCPAPKNAPHPTQKPVPLMEHYIRNSSQPGEVVLDPFMGGGTTLIAASNLGRKSIGIEQDEKWFRLACQRLREEVATRTTFESTKGTQAMMDLD